MRVIDTDNINFETVAFLTLGCKVNSYETDAMQKLFEEEGFRVVDFSSKADVYVINTCTVTNIADRKSRQMLHKARKMNENAIVIAVGCYVQAAEETLKEDEKIDLVIGNNRKKDIVHILKEYVYGEESTGTVVDIGKEAYYEELTIESVAEKTRAYIKIQDGCNQFCSYCIIPYARGRVRSRKQEDVVDEVNRLVEKGYKEIILTGIHLSSYGIDLDKENKTATMIENQEEQMEKDYEEGMVVKRNHLLELIVAISKNEKLQRIRLGSLEPRIITEEFVKTLSGNTKLCPHFHLSLQSGCDTTLKRMNRRYDTTEYYEKCKLLREYFVNPAITTDIIVGFPGETEEEFSATKEFLEKVDFASMHIFKYSIRKGTKAATMKPQIQEDIKTYRSNILADSEHRMSTKYRETFLGNIEHVLIEEEITVNGDKYQVGHNERNIKLAIKSEESLSNQVIKVKVMSQLDKDIMFCEIMD